MYFVVDRIENGVVVLEGYDKTHTQVSKECFDFSVSEGDVVIKNENGYSLDEKQTTLRKEHIKALSKKLFGE